ncbi:Gfo/Idh/MocA family protein [Streptomyces sp. NPDC058286]|uniref:Gfo/Idh/MocA family protein n=1 Tax=Streptomyces sp. NPDC058286 TaxID=3346422 RepID=UPI0036EF0D7F
MQEFDDLQQGNPMQGAIVGFGTIAQGHLHGYGAISHMAIPAVVDICESRRASARDLGLSAYESLDALFADFRPDFLDICTPPGSHAGYIEAALDRGIPALCEKPVFVPPAATYMKLLRRLSQSRDGILYPCQNYKFAPIFNYVRDLIDSGDIGDIIRVNVAVLRSGHAKGVQDWLPDWRRDETFSVGGILRDHGPHGIYLATSTTGLVPKSVSCVLGKMRGKEIFDLEDTSILRIKCTGGEDIEISLTWAAGLRDSRYLFVGTRGFISIENDNLTIGRDGGIKRISVRSDFDDPSHRKWFTAMFADFHEIVSDPKLRDTRLLGLINESLVTTAVVDAGYESARSASEWVEVPRIVFPGVNKQGG